MYISLSTTWNCFARWKRDRTVAPGFMLRVASDNRLHSHSMVQVVTFPDSSFSNKVDLEVVAFVDVVVGRYHPVIDVLDRHLLAQLLPGLDAFRVVANRVVLFHRTFSRDIVCEASNDIEPRFVIVDPRDDVEGIVVLEGHEA